MWLKGNQDDDDGNDSDKEKFLTAIIITNQYKYISKQVQIDHDTMYYNNDRRKLKWEANTKKILAL